MRALSIYSPRERGFTLLEVLVVSAILMLTMGFLMYSFSVNRANVQNETDLFISNIRRAQSYAVSSKALPTDGTLRCGYGIRYIDARTYAIYAGADTATTICSGQNRNYNAGIDVDAETITIKELRVDILAPFSNIFFEPPDPKTYINNNPTVNGTPASVTIRTINADCSVDNSSCRVICIYPSGKIETVQQGIPCPAL